MIYRQDAIDAIVTWTVEDRPDIEMPTDLVDRVNALPSAERKGKWIPYGVARYRCSECGKVQSGDRDSDLNYCCNCGSRNEVSEDD